MSTISSSLTYTAQATLQAAQKQSAVSTKAETSTGAEAAAKPHIRPGSGISIRLDLMVLSSVSTTQAIPKNDFAAVARATREALDAGYDQLGKVADMYTTGKDSREIVGYENLDRRALWAIASNEGGHFSEWEQRTALSTSGHRASVLGKNANPFGTDPVAAFKANLEYLNDASPEEKANSFAWRAQLAVAQWSYNAAAEWEGKTPGYFEYSDDPIVKMLMAGMDERSKLGDPSNRFEDMPAYKQALEAFQSETARKT